VAVGHPDCPWSIWLSAAAAEEEVNFQAVEAVLVWF
jgi:hypothetical protein